MYFWFVNAKGEDCMNFVLGVHANTNICNWPENFACLKLVFSLAFLCCKSLWHTLNKSLVINFNSLLLVLVTIAKNNLAFPVFSWCVCEGWKNSSFSSSSSPVSVVAPAINRSCINWCHCTDFWVIFLTSHIVDELQKQLTITQELLTEVMPSYSEESAEACSVLKELKEKSQKLDKDLQRYLQQLGEKTHWLHIQKKIYRSR